VAFEGEVRKKRPERFHSLSFYLPTLLLYTSSYYRVANMFTYDNLPYIGLLIDFVLDKH
jgi:hypothetical protein